MRGSDRAVFFPTALAAAFHVAAIVFLDRAALTAGVFCGALEPRWLVSTQLARHRIIALTASLVLLAVIRALRWPRGWVVSLPVAGAAVCLTWLAVLEGMLALGPVYALGLLGVAAAASVHLTGALWTLTRPGAARRAVLRGALLVGSVAIGAYLVEGIARLSVPLNIYEPVPDDFGGAPAFDRDDDGRLIGTPGFRGKYMHPEFPGVPVALNQRGFRDGLDEPFPPNHDHPVVLVLGDSFAFGCGVRLEETFQERIEEDLPDTQVVCAALPGYGQFQELRILNELMDPVDPDVVLVALYEGNDFADNLQAEAREMRLSSPSTPPKTRLRRPGLGTFLGDLARLPYWYGSSSMGQLLRPRIEQWQERRGGAKRSIPTNRLLNLMMASSPHPYAGQGALHTLMLIERMKRRAEEGGARFLVLMIPAAIQASPVRYREFLDAQPGDPSAFDRELFHRGFIGELQRMGIEVIDPGDRIAIEEESGRPCYYREGHWNARGHAIAAELAVPAVRAALDR